MKSRRTKKTLISSMVSLVLCLAMLVGSTLAWFTDTINVTADLNFGSLNVALQKYIDGEYKNVGTKDNDANYGSTDPVFGGTNWTPNQTEVYYLAVSNEGSIAFNYDMQIKLEGDMTGALSYAIIDGLKADDPEAEDIDLAVEQKKWDQIVEKAGGQTGLVEEGELQAAPNGHLEANTADYFALILHMDENADNEYQGTYFDVDIVVNARQVSYVEPQPEVEDPFAEYTLLKAYDFEEENFTFDTWNSANVYTGVLPAKGAPGTVTLETDGTNHYTKIERIYTDENRPTAFTSENRIRVYGIKDVVAGQNVVLYSFDIKQFEAGAPMMTSFSMKLVGDKILYATSNNEEPVEIVDLSDGEWHNVAVEVDFAKGTATYYGDKVVKKADGKGLTAPLDFLMIGAHEYGYPSTTDADHIKNHSVGIDNIKVMVPPASSADEIFADYTVAKEYNFENGFALGAYDATTGVGAYKPAPSNIIVDAEGENHFVRMSRIYDTRPAVMGTEFRIQFNEIFTPEVIAADEVVYSFDVKQFVEDSFSSLGFANIKMANDKVSVSLGAEDTEPVTLVDLSDGEWHNIAVEVDYKNSTIRYYGDGVLCEKVVQGTGPDRASTVAPFLRFQVDSYNWPALDEEDLTNNVDFGIDNFKVMIPAE